MVDPQQGVYLNIIDNLVKEIDRRRKENHEYDIPWNPDNVSEAEQAKLLDYIEAELAKLNRLLEGIQ